MNKFLFLILIALVASKNYILVGDSRYVGMAVLLMGFDYSTVTPSWGTGTNVCSASARSYGGHSIQVTAQVSASSYTYKQGTQIYNSVHNQLRKAAAGTSVLLWLGINDPSAVQSTYDFYAGLAKSYPSLNFYAISVTGVDPNRVTYISNSKVQNFNSQLASKISNGRYKNLQYRSILSGNNVNKIMVDGSAVDITGYMTDGLHYKKSGYSLLWKAMSQKA